MDRLICGDVGFGKTEVALRAAFVAAMAAAGGGRRADDAAGAPAFQDLSERFAGCRSRSAGLSRLVRPRSSPRPREGLADGKIDIVVGTHALLARGQLQGPRPLIVDEEQHFGVKHKERLKELRADVHVLTLTATPIPRTLQLALTGVRELSIIATPPVDRLAVRTYISPFDPV
jgi:transcription-repair coupling factor (superfamily II helicase)